MSEKLIINWLKVVIEIEVKNSYCIKILNARGEFLRKISASSYIENVIPSSWFTKQLPLMQVMVAW